LEFEAVDGEDIFATISGKEQRKVKEDVVKETLQLEECEQIKIIKQYKL